VSNLLGPWYAYRDFLQWILEGIANTVHSGGLAIIIFTIIVKTILLPLTLKSIRSMKAMQDIQPKIKELQKKHGKNREELQKQTMALYAAHQVNPVAGCLPMLIQIPIFFGVYHAINNLANSGSGYFGGPFLWLSSLGDADAWKILPIAAGVFQFVQMRMSRPRNAPAASDPQQQIMNTMMNIMPLMVIVFGWTFASGAVLYWATQSIYSAVQQWFVSGWGQLKNYAEWLPEMPEHRRLGYVAPRNVDDIVVEYGTNGRPKASGLMGKMQARLEEAQRLQEERQGQVKGQTGPARGTAGKPVTAKTGAAKATSAAGEAAATTTTPAAARPRTGQRSAKKRTSAKRAAGAQPVMATSAITPDIVEAEVTEVEDIAPAQPAKSSASYADRVSSASRRGPKSSWSSSRNAPLAGAGGNTETGED